jgi:hypothetical protein
LQGYGVSCISKKNNWLINGDSISHRAGEIPVESIRVHVRSSAAREMLASPQDRGEYANGALIANQLYVSTNQFPHPTSHIPQHEKLPRACHTQPQFPQAILIHSLPPKPTRAESSVFRGRITLLGLRVGVIHHHHVGTDMAETR